MAAIRERVSTGIDCLYTVLEGGFVPGRAYLARGEPGTRKTIFGYHYLAAGGGARFELLGLLDEDWNGDGA